MTKQDYNQGKVTVLGDNPQIWGLLIWDLLTRDGQRGTGKRQSQGHRLLEKGHHARHLYTCRNRLPSPSTIHLIQATVLFLGTLLD
jgi:hypothetical protein